MPTSHKAVHDVQWGCLSSHLSDPDINSTLSISIIDEFHSLRTHKLVNITLPRYTQQMNSSPLKLV